jgi:hypothetical protein
MDARAIFRVSEQIRQRLLDALASTDPPLPSNVYVGPLDDAQATNADLVLFLYRICPTADLRNDVRRLPSPIPDGPPRIIEGAIPLTLHYMLTAPTYGGTAVDDLRALHALGRAIQVLNDEPELSGVAVDGETVRISFDPLNNEEMGRIWTLFPAINYRTSVAYVVTPVWIDPDTTRSTGAPVTEATTSVGAGVPT